VGLLRRCAPRNDIPFLPSLRAERSNLGTGEGGVDKVYCVYIVTNQRNTVLYTGVTGDLAARAYQHREKLLRGFTVRYNVSRLVYYEAGYDASGAIAREKQIKAGSRQKKIDLINGFNPEWRDLYDDL
jgi:putative endonuclease